jgi:acetyltransferase-like isoleucine patch superfamily enzyme
MKRALRKMVRRETKTDYIELSHLVHSGVHTYGLEHLNLHSWNDENRIYIGSFCSIADNFHVFLGGNHRMDWISTFPFGQDNNMRGPRDGHPLSKGDVSIGHDVWIGSHVSIMSGIKIGNGAVVAAYSHVIKDIKPYEVVGGNPADHIRFRFDLETIKFLEELQWWNWPEDVLREGRDLLSSPPTTEIRHKLLLLRDASR